MINWGNPTRHEIELINKIAWRALRLAKEKAQREIDLMDLEMDLTATHASNPLRLDDLLNADEFNFVHDVWGIREHLNRRTGKLENYFVPRFSK